MFSNVFNGDISNFRYICAYIDVYKNREAKNLITSYKVLVHLKMMIHTHAYISYMLYMLYVYCINYLWNE